VTSTERIEAAARAYSPELWPDDLSGYTPMQRGQLTFLRQGVIERITAALAAADEAERGKVGKFDLPDDVGMLEQTLVAFSYIDREGKTAYGVRSAGEGLLTTWLGMAELAKHFLLQQQLTGGWEIRDEENGD